MNLLLLRANPNKGGFTQQCVENFLKGVRETQTQIEDVDLTNLDLKPCRGCFKCWTVTPGKCIQADEMKNLLEKFLNADLLVLATPLYAFSMSSYLKIFMERTLPLLCPQVCAAGDGLDRNILRFPDRGPSKMTAIIAGGLKDKSHSAGVIESLRLFARGFDIEFCGALTRPESFAVQFTDTQPKTIKAVENAFICAGKQFAEKGTVDTEYLETASKPLAYDFETFERYSSIYWEHASEIYRRKGTPDQIRLLTNNDIRILMHEMSRCLDPIATKRVSDIIEFNFSDKKLCYSIIIDKGTCRVLDHGSPSPSLQILCESETWVKILRRELEPIKALMEGALKLKGDKQVFSKLGKYFLPRAN